MIISLLIGRGNNAMNKVYNDNSKIDNASNTFGLDENEEIIELGTYKGRLRLSGSGTIRHIKLVGYEKRLF
ncbi:hypothetical protein KQI42_06510 [Tissierella sp. MSJ-40]|uniref:Uncharacterized protein n=1 Tax=Tissierella simiarum TaxID=2841534 RepID=A0ABS6E5F7_9FIRM|nr:hypothetical protein [Tissierella simiarum]MBU5437650.1 hypothetical protein [Tissierella simiarum]